MQHKLRVTGGYEHLLISTNLTYSTETTVIKTLAAIAYVHLAAGAKYRSSTREVQEFVCHWTARVNIRRVHHREVKLLTSC